MTEGHQDKSPPMHSRYQTTGSQRKAHDELHHVRLCVNGALLNG